MSPHRTSYLVLIVNRGQARNQQLSTINQPLLGVQLAGVQCGSSTGRHEDFLSFNFLSPLCFCATSHLTKRAHGRATMKLSKASITLFSYYYLIKFQTQYCFLMLFLQTQYSKPQNVAGKSLAIFIASMQTITFLSYQSSQSWQ